MNIEKFISYQIERQFPSIFREDGRELVELVTYYYKFLEENDRQSVYNNRRLFEYRDIDNTLQNMVLFFKNKYMKDLPLDDANTRFILKHILDLYRRKGTPEGIEIFFKLFYNEDVTIYYPAEAMLKPSTSNWKSGIFLQLYPTSIDALKDLPTKNIVGSISKAEAIVDRVLFILANNVIFPLVYLNNVRGTFRGFDDILFVENGVIQNYGKVYGSLDRIEILTDDARATTGNNIGDQLTVSYLDAKGGKVIVTGVTENITGEIEYTVTESGFGYTSENTLLYVSNQVLFVDNTALNFNVLERVEDQFGNTGTVIGQNDILLGVRMDEGSEFVETSTVLTSDRASPFDKVLTAKDESISAGVFYTLSEAISRAASNLEPELSRFNVIISGSRKLGDINNSGTITNNDALQLEQYFAGVEIDQAFKDYIEGPFKTYIESNLATYGNYAARKIIMTTPFVVPKNDSSPGPLYPEASNTELADSVQLTELDNVETVSLITDVINNFKDVPLNSLNFNDVPPALIPMSGIADPVTLATRLDEAFDLTPFEIGSIRRFSNVRPGSDYINRVFAIAYDEAMVNFDVYNQAITLEEISAVLEVGGIIRQGSKSGKILSIQGNTIFVLPYTYFGFEKAPITYNGRSFNVLSISRDYTSKKIGFNAIIDTSTEFAVGKILAVDVTNSGYGYSDGVQVSLLDNTGRVRAVGTARARGQGKIEGRWSSQESHLNFQDGKVLQDSNYYQDYSYEISSTIDINTYKSTLDEIAHLAGTKMFGKFSLREGVDVSSNARITIIRET
jgi:hypothetical protein